MTDKTMEKLRSLLKAYGERTAKPGAGSAAGVGVGVGVGVGAHVKPVTDAGEQRRRACGDRLQNVVRPVLQGFMAELRSAGHEASVDDHTDSADAYPSVVLAFQPRLPSGTALTSVLTFRYDPRRGLAVSRDIKASARGRVVTASTDRIGTMKVEAVTPDWIESKALSFIEAVLRAN